MLLIQWSQRCSIQPSGHSVTVHVYRLLMRPWAMHWTQAAPEASLLLTMSSDPLGVWTCLRGICKEFLITLYVWGALNSCVKLHRLVHLKTHHASASGSAHQTRAELLRFIRVTHLLCTLFSFLALCGFPNLTCWVCFEAWQCGKSTPAFTLWRVLLFFFFFLERLEHLTKIFHSFTPHPRPQSFSFLYSHCTLIALTKNNMRICHR